MITNAANAYSYHSVGFENCPGWRQDNQGLAYGAFYQSAIYAARHQYKDGLSGLKFADLEPAFSAARIAGPGLQHNDFLARQFFEQYFSPCKIVSSQAKKYGFVTGFYEPEIDASLVKTDEFSVPFYRRPTDLIKLTDSNRPETIADDYAFGRCHQGDITEYHDRQAIDNGALEHQNLEIAYVRCKVDAYFAHVQGAVRLRLPDGTIRRLTYAAKSGHPFTGAGAALIGCGELAADRVTMQSIRTWLADHPQRVDEILWKNRSYIFFREAPVADDNAGPVAAAKVPLTAGRSIAVDRKLHCFATPFFLDVHGLDIRASLDKPVPFQRLMIAQDTGTAIVGAARGDLFIGSGFEAGEIAGKIRHHADFYMLVPHHLVGRITS